MRLQTVRAISAFTIALAAFLSPSIAGPETKDPAGNVSGEAEFLRYCVLRNGADVQGLGLLTGEGTMKKSVGDSTLIAKRNGGGSPLSRIADTILDGRNVPGHTSSQMMTWGRVFSAHSDPATAKAGIIEIAWLVEGLQE